jgi:hypothetical protein
MNCAAPAWGCTRKFCQAARPLWAAAVGLSSAVVASTGVTRKTCKEAAAEGRSRIAGLEVVVEDLEGLIDRTREGAAGVR